MVGQVQWRIEKRVDRIADQFIHHAAMFQHDAAGQAEIGVQHPHQLARAKAVGQAAEILDIGEKRGHHPRLAAQFQQVRFLDQPRDHGGGHQLTHAVAQPLLGAGGLRGAADQGE